MGSADCGANSYETEVDEFDNEELYTQGAYFILRAIMKMHGTEI